MGAIIAFVVVGIAAGVAAFLRATRYEPRRGPTEARRASMGARLVW